MPNKEDNRSSAETFFCLAKHFKASEIFSMTQLPAESLCSTVKMGLAVVKKNYKHQ